MSAPPPIHPDLLAFFNYARHEVTAEDISNNILNDPGSHHYFQAWEAIRTTGIIPEEHDLDLEEGMAWLAVSDACTRRNPLGFQAFRRFTHAVGLILVSWDWQNEGELIIFNYLTLNMVRDLIPGNQKYLGMVRNAMRAIRASHDASAYSQEYPFFLLADILLAQKDKDFRYAEQTAALLLNVETKLRQIASWSKKKPFLLGLTSYDSLHAEWLEACRELTNPNCNPEMELLISLLDELRVGPG